MADSYAAAMRVIGNANWCGSRAAAGRPVGCSYGIAVDRRCCRIRGATFARPDRPSRASAIQRPRDGGRARIRSDPDPDPDPRGNAGGQSQRASARQTTQTIHGTTTSPAPLSAEPYHDDQHHIRNARPRGSIAPPSPSRWRNRCGHVLQMHARNRIGPELLSRPEFGVTSNRASSSAIAVHLATASAPARSRVLALSRPATSTEAGTPSTSTCSMGTSSPAQTVNPSSCYRCLTQRCPPEPTLAGPRAG